MNERDDPERPIDDEGREAMLAALLRRHPRAVVAALDIDGRLVDLPPSLGLAGQHLVPSHVAPDLVQAGSRAAVFESWNQVKLIGAAVTPVVLLNGVEASCYVIDLRHRHGVLVGLTVADVPIELVEAVTDRSPVGPGSVSGGVVGDDVAGETTDRIEAALGVHADSPALQHAERQ